jgi:hypothetical protein
MPSYINIEDRYRLSSIRERQMHYVWAATAAAVVSVGATAAGTAMSYSASQKAGKAQAAASKKAARQEKKALKGQQAAAAQYEAEMGQIQAHQWNIRADIDDAERITGYNEAQLEFLYPGARSQRQLASMAISDFIQGRGPQGATEQTLRDVAQFGGAGFNIATAGKSALPGVVQTTQANLARHIGDQAVGFTKYGISALGDWTRLASAFIASPLQVGQARLGFEQAATDLAMQQATARYNARAGLAGEQKRMAGTAYERALEGAKIDLATGQQLASGITSTGQAVAEAGKTYSDIQSKKEYIEALKGLDSYGQYDTRLNDPNTPYLFGSKIRKTSDPYNTAWNWNTPITSSYA